MKTIENPSKYLGNEMEYLSKVLASESWSATGGSWVQELEQRFADRFGTRYAIAFNSGTATLHAALEAVGVRAGDEVISPALTVIMDTTATLHANAIPVYADVDPETFNIDHRDLERKITSKTKAIITVSLYGLPADMDPILDIARKHKIAVIEDNAQCFLGTYKGKLAGTLGDMASFSFENSKHLSCGEGGMLITSNETLAERVRKIGGHGFKNLRADEGRIRLNRDVFQDPDYKRHDTLGWNYRMPEFCAAVTLAQLEQIDRFVEMRVKSAEYFIDVMKSECDYLIPQRTPEGYKNSYFTLGALYLGDQAIGVSWQEFRRAYIQEGGDGIYAAWSVPYLEPLMAERSFVQRLPEIYESVTYGPGICPVAERIQGSIMQFKANYRDLRLAEMKADILRRVIRKFRKR